MFFYLKEPNNDKETIIIIQYYIADEKKNFKYSTGEVIHPSDWDFSARAPKNKKGQDGARLRKITTYIMQYNDFLVTILDNFKLNNEKVTREKLKKAFDKQFKPKKCQKEFIFFTDFIDNFIQNNRKEINQNTGKIYTKSIIYQYAQTCNILNDFEQHLKKRIKIEEYNSSINTNFINYCYSVRKNSPNTIGQYVSIIKILLKIAKKQGYNISSDLEDFTKMKEKTIAVVLSESEIETLFNYDFSDNKNLENARDLMIIGVWTGLRVSDFMHLPTINPESKFIEVEPKKTRNTSGAKVVIPLHHHIKEIIKKRGMPSPLSEIEFNFLIKQIGKIIGLTQPIEGTLMNPKTRRKEKGVYEKWQLISSHTCRRSFATNLYLMNFPTLSIMKITGHTTEASFLKYIKVTPKEHAQKLLDHWELYYKNKH